MVAVEFFMALMMACPIAEAACLVARMALLKHWTARFHHLQKVLRVLRELLVHPLHFELGALITLCIFACCPACLNGRESLACFQKWGPWLEAPRMTLGICTTLLVACMGFLHLLVHLFMILILMIDVEAMVVSIMVIMLVVAMVFIVSIVVPIVSMVAMVSIASIVVVMLMVSMVAMASIASL